MISTDSGLYANQKKREASSWKDQAEAFRSNQEFSAHVVGSYRGDAFQGSEYSGGGERFVEQQLEGTRPVEDRGVLSWIRK